MDQSLEIFEQQYGEELIQYLGPIHKRAKTTQQMQFISTMSEMVCTAILIKKLEMQTPDALHKTVETIREIAEKYRGCNCHRLLRIPWVQAEERRPRKHILQPRNLQDVGGAPSVSLVKLPQ
ncbi:hypothetical protein TNCV_3352801 [Trichonephila clavipes]|nr:hypothetical protein TNCV_3352801 [Trichonephila clavipes]